MKKSWYLLIPLAAIIALTIYLVLNNEPVLPETPTAEQSCISSGGTVATSLCCGSVNAFPNTCAIGACGCAPNNSHNVSVCNCGEGKCFNGTACVVQG